MFLKNRRKSIYIAASQKQSPRGVLQNSQKYQQRTTNIEVHFLAKLRVEDYKLQELKSVAVLETGARG